MHNIRYLLSEFFTTSDGEFNQKGQGTLSGNN